MSQPLKIRAKTFDQQIAEAHRRGWEDAIEEVNLRPWSGDGDASWRERSYQDSLRAARHAVREPIMLSEQEPLPT